MSYSICFGANNIDYPEGGGHFWEYVNWALGFISNGCKVYWLERVKINDELSAEKARKNFKILQTHLSTFDLDKSIVLLNGEGDPLPVDLTQETIDITVALQADLLFNVQYHLPQSFVSKFRKSAFLDYDPGLLQIFMSNGEIKIAKHDVYFSIGETAGKPSARFPNAGVRWDYASPSIALDYWFPKDITEAAPYTTISHWNTEEWVMDEDGKYYNNGKKNAFIPFLDLPKHTNEKMELALCLHGDKEEIEFLNDKGWLVRESWDVSTTPDAYQKYIEGSKGEFSCAKPHYVKLETAWLSNRTLCYLASGKPAIVEHTGPSQFLPDNDGLHRFKNFNDALKAINEVQRNYDKHCKVARELVEEYFDARKGAKRLLEKIF